MRVWLQPGGHVTPMHYDGNSLHGFNLQIRGAKRWTLLAPDADLPLIPFELVSTVSDDFTPDPSRCTVYRFDTGPGDTLFLPRYWFHKVASLPIVERLCMRRLPPLDDYGGGGRGLASRYADGVGVHQGIKRLLLELARYARFLPVRRRVMNQIRAFAMNNFRV